MSPIIHFEMLVKDIERIPKFYENDFGWQITWLGPEIGNFVLAYTTETDESRTPIEIGANNCGFCEEKQEFAAKNLKSYISLWFSLRFSDSRARYTKPNIETFL